jgi:hypothetical protein
MRMELPTEGLQSLAREARPVSQSAFFPLIKFAERWGIDVELQLYANGKSRDAQSVLSPSQLGIVIYRRSDTNGVVKLTPQHERFLRPRERFSLAHELGHCLAYRQFGILPENNDTKEYWQQERCMNDFATSLLVPDWLRKCWLETVSADAPVSPSSLTTWGVNHCGVSAEVIAHALSRSESSVGFLKTAEAVRNNDGKRIFVVFHSSYGSRLRLPNVHAFVDDHTFVDRITGTTGTGSIDAGFTSDPICETLNLCWQRTLVSTDRRRREFRSGVALSGTGYWISFRSHGPRATPPKDEAQLRLFD